VCVFVTVFITAGPITKLFAGGGRRRVEDMCYERRRAAACVDESAQHALANTGGREIVGKKEGEQKGSARGSVHWGCLGLLLQPWTSRMPNFEMPNLRVVLCGIAVSKWSQEAQNHNASTVDYNVS
jgi:hypothetical protein